MRPPVCATCKHDASQHFAGGLACAWTGVHAEGALTCTCTEYVAPATTVMADTRHRLDEAEKRIAELERVLSALLVALRDNSRIAELEVKDLAAAAELMKGAEP